MESPTTPPNPYATPSANLYGSTTGVGAEAVAPSTIAQLSGTKSWVRLMSVLMWIGAIFMIIAAVMMLFAGSAGLSTVTGNKTGPTTMLVAMALYYGVLSFVMIYPALKLGKYANFIGKLKASHTLADLDGALTEQRRYWKFSGILVIIMLCLTAVAVVAVMVFGASLAMKGGAFPN